MVGMARRLLGPGAAVVVVAVQLLAVALLHQPMAVQGFAPPGENETFVNCTRHSEEEVTCGGRRYMKVTDEPTEVPEVVEGCEELSEPGSTKFYLNLLAALIAICCAGMMSGLTVGLMSFEEKNLAILVHQSENEEEKMQAKRVLELIKDHHRCLVTLLLWNAAAFECLPLFIAKLVHEAVAVLISVTFILVFGEIVPQALCTGPKRLKLGSMAYVPMKILMFVSFPLVWPFKKALDEVMGHRDERDSQFLYVPRGTLGLEEDGRLALVELHGYTDKPKQKPKPKPAPATRVTIESPILDDPGTPSPISGKRPISEEKRGLVNGDD